MLKLSFLLMMNICYVRISIKSLNKMSSINASQKKDSRKKK